MFCPKCSQPQSSEEARFCPRCGFPVGAVREMVGREEARAAEEVHARGEDALPAQKDISTGACLMFAGGVAAVLWGLMGTRPPAEVLLPQAYLILGLALVFLLTLFHPLLGRLEELSGGGGAPADYTPRRRDGINLGALLMFAATLKAMLATCLMPAGPERGVTTLLIMSGMLLLLMLLRPLLQAAHGIFFKTAEQAEEPEAGTTARLDPADRSAAALPPAHSVPVGDFAPARLNTAELAAPPSVTDETTRKLGSS